MVASGVGIHNAAYAEIQKIRAFHALAHHPRVLQVYRELLGDEVVPHPRHIARLILPAQFNKPTPPHQDYIHIQGTKNVWTMWIPVGDCPREMGNLTAIRGSHKDGLLPVAAAQGAGGLEAHLCAGDYEWVEDDFEAGDVLTFPSLMVHKALTPKVTDRVRLSCDFRFQRADEEIEAASLRPHGDVVTWDEVYAEWPEDDPLRYYWKKHDLRMAEWDDSIRWQKEKIC
jgi:ectoine hydroxylase-related dioxygenase (phytanoyl-CoA dioxygenase family)